MCRCTITFALVAMLCAAALGALGAPPAAAFTMAGTVVDADTGAPLTGIHYELALTIDDLGVLGLVESSGTTGTDGRFTASGSGMGWGDNVPFYFDLTFTDPNLGYCGLILDRQSRLDDWPTGQWVDPPDETGMVVALTKATGPDTTAPHTSIDLIRSPFWSHKPVTATLTATDDQPPCSGVARTEYRLDDGPWIEGTEVTVPAPVDHSNDGMHTMYFFSVDNAGNAESPNQWQVMIDTRRPRILSAGPCTMVSGYGTINLAVRDDRSSFVTVVLTLRRLGHGRAA